jgi:hypothetical protein
MATSCGFESHRPHHFHRRFGALPEQRGRISHHAQGGCVQLRNKVVGLHSLAIFRDVDVERKLSAIAARVRAEGTESVSSRGVTKVKRSERRVGIAAFLQVVIVVVGFRPDRLLAESNYTSARLVTERPGQGKSQVSA